MAEERRQNIFVTLATDGLVLRRRAYDAVVQYPLSEDCIAPKDGMIPGDVMVDLGRNALSLDDFEVCVDALGAVFKSLGCKMAGDMDMQYCRMSINGGPDEVLGELVLSFIVK